MKLLKFEITGVPNFNNTLCIDFVARQRVAADDAEQLYNVFSNIYVNQVLSFIGINASGKTTILKTISFVISLLNNESINNITSKEIFDDLKEKQKVELISYFYHENFVYKLITYIEKKNNPVDGNSKLMISDEVLLSKGIHRVKTKKSIYDFKEADLSIQRNQNEQFLPGDVSIIIALNKKINTKFSMYDMSQLTDYNMLNFLGNYPKEILSFLDPSIEYLYCKQDGKEADIKLKFYEKDEVTLNHPAALNRYLSSGTIKGLSIFMGAVFTFIESGYLVVDELENHFNKEIVSTLIRFFLDKKVNKKGSILVFSTHYSELLDQFDRNDSIYIVKNKGGISAVNLSDILKRNDIKKSEVYDSDFLGETVPAYNSYLSLKKVLMKLNDFKVEEDI